MRKLIPSRAQRLLALVLLGAALLLAMLQIPAVAAAVNSYARRTAEAGARTWNRLASLRVVAAQPASPGAAQQGAGGWPSLPQQLSDAKVRPGTALEALIRAHQDFALLRLDEIGDQRGLPPWLRVWWRKAHPEIKYSAEDPTGGYPLVLKEILEWMVTHQDLQPGMGREPGEEERQAQRWIEWLLSPSSLITGEQRISPALNSPHSESDIRINFFDPNKIISGSNNVGGTGQQAMFYSINGGASWNQTNLALVTGDSFHSDPTVDWTSDGRAWSSTLGINASVTVLRLRNYFSSDNGATWTFEATASGTQSSVDKQMVWVDHSSTSPYFNQMYAIWHNGAPAYMNRRTAGAAGTWGVTPLRVSGTETTGTGIGGDVKTNSFGDVFGFWPDTGSRRVLLVKSTNGGASYSTPLQITTTFDGYDIGVPAFNNRRALIYISGGAYRTANKDLVYAAWTDLSGETGCTSAANEPGLNVGSPCKTRIWFARSTNGGAGWSAPVKLNNQPGLNDQFNQWLAVDEASGAVGIIYYDTVADAGRKKTHLYYQRSFDDGATWSAPERITTGQTDESTGADSNQYGDYNGLSAYAGVLFPSWTDRRSGASEEVWTARLYDPTCTAPSTPVLTGVTASGANQLTVNWTNGTTAATSFKIYRATGSCAAPGAFMLLASGVTGTSYTDTTVSGGATYAYRVAGVEATGVCESAQSNCGSATAAGACTLPPSFAGLATVANPAQVTCSLSLNWPAATPQCGGPVSYQVYRSTTSGFTPSAGNLVNTVSGTTYTDSGGLTNGLTYYYIVRAVDGSNGAADGNTVEKSGMPTGPTVMGTFTETFEGAASGGGFDHAGWTRQVLSGTNNWMWSTARAHTPTHSWFSPSQSSVGDRVLVSPSFIASAGTVLSFWHTYSFEGDVLQAYDGGTLEYSTNGGAAWEVVPENHFTAGVYNATINNGFGNPLGGVRGWASGSLGAMNQVVVNLGAFAGQSLKLRWHAGDDSGVAGAGWYVDSVTIANAGTASVCTAIVCPTITLSPTNLPPGTAGTAYSQMLSASGGTGSYSFALANGSSLPGGLTLSGSGLLSGTPSVVGAFNFTVTATDVNGCTGSALLTLSIGCPALSVTPTTLPQGTVGTAYNQTLNGNGGAAPYSFALAHGASLPSGLSLSTGGALSGTPTAAGSFSFAVNVTDGRSCTGSSTVALTLVCPTLTVSPATLPQGSVGQLYNQTLNGNGGAAPYTFALANGSSLPNGLMLASNGTLSGTPTATGTSNFTVNVTDQRGCTGSSTITLTINNCPLITINPASLPAGTVGAAYSQSFTQNGGAGAGTFSLSGTLPAGLSFSPATATLAGTPTQTGSFPLTINVTDNNGCPATRNYTLTINCPAIAVSPPGLPEATVGASYHQTISATPALAYSYSVTSGVLPPGLTLNAATGTLAGTPILPGVYAFTVTAAFGNCTGSQSYSLRVNGPPRAVAGDFDGDGKSDLGVWRGSSGNWLSLNSSNGVQQTQQWGAGWAPYFDTIVPGDYDGDGKTDHAIWRGQDSIWYIRKSSDGQPILRFWGANYAPYFDVPTPADYDGDGKTDLAVWRRDGTWFVWKSSNGAYLIETWGQTGDTPVPGDYDGDGKTDLAIWRGSTGAWLIKLSGGGTQTTLWGAGYAPYFDVPVQADYDGDGKTDLGIWRGADSIWYLRKSSDGQPILQFWGANYAPYFDVPTPGDYDGDGKADIAVWRRDGAWYVRKSSDGTALIQAHGQSGDKPVTGRN
jgi:hypothetical protein